MFALLATAAGTVVYLGAAVIGMASGLSATLGFFGPRFLAAEVGTRTLWICLVGVVFLAFDVVRRDHRDRIADVVGVLPASNLELMFGRTVALTVTAWLPLVLVGVAAQLFGVFAEAAGWWFGEPMQSAALATFLAADALPALFFWCALVVLLAVLLPVRWLVALVAFALLGLQLWALGRVAPHLAAVVSTVAGHSAAVGAPSDLLSGFSGAGLLQRLLIVTLAAGILTLAAVVHERPDDRRRRRVGAAVALGTVGSAGLFGLAAHAAAAVKEQEAWAATHRSVDAGYRQVDITDIRATVRIIPGKRVELDATMGFGVTGTGDQEQLAFSLNPGIVVHEVLVDGSAMVYEHVHGLLTVSAATGSVFGEHQMRLRASGAPLERFAYPQPVKSQELAARLALLGSQASIFERNYVALTPALRWLPAAGPHAGRQDPARCPRDFFLLDLDVEVPSGWLPVAPGKREKLEATSEAARFRFRPAAPISEVALVASRFERFAVAVDGVDVELLLSPLHTRNMALFADAAGDVRGRLEELLGRARRMGLSYPYPALSLVEVPSRLRGYGDGWRMETTLAPGGMVLLREQGFPTSRFELALDAASRTAEPEGGVKVRALERFFARDLSGGDALAGAARNLLLQQTGAAGDGATALEFVLGTLVNRLLIDRPGHFFAGTFVAPSYVVAVQQALARLTMGDAGSLADAAARALADKPESWERVLDTALVDIEAVQDIDVLTLKGGAVARSIADGLGIEKTSAMLAQLRQRHRGASFTADDAAAAAAAVGVAFEPLIGDWLRETSLPGFVTSEVTTVRIADDAQGQPRYQTTVHVRNDESTPGLFRLRYTGPDHSAALWTGPVHVPGQTSVQFGLLTGWPLGRLSLSPYLALNRNDVALIVPEVNAAEAVGRPPLIGARSSDWVPDWSDSIVVDDLDSGFSIEVEGGDAGARVVEDLASLAAAGELHLDHGLPVSEVFAGVDLHPGWGRQPLASAWGRYRRTTARALGGDGRRKAVFTAQLPVAALWELGYHIPLASNTAGMRRRRYTKIDFSLGRYDMELKTGSQAVAIQFDGALATPGWNTLGRFELPAGVARLMVSDKTNGLAVIADAVRWRPVAERRQMQH